MQKRASRREDERRAAHTAMPVRRPDEPRPASLPAHLLALQREAGNAAVSRAVTSLSRGPAAATANGRPLAVQRLIGFEYETSADTYLAPHALSATERQVRGFAAGSQRLAKADVVVGNASGLHLKADLGGAGLGTNLEFETDAFPETPAGRDGLSSALKRLERIAAFIEGGGVTHADVHFRGSHLAAAFGGAAPVPLRYVRRNGTVTGNPQATAAVRIERIAELMERTVGAPTGGPHVVNAAAPLHRVELGGQNLPDLVSVGDAPRHVRAQIAAYLAGPHPAPPPGFPSEALVGLCALALTYIRKGQGGALAYAKSIAPIMARTDFAQLFRDIPRLEQDFLGPPGAQMVPMWNHIILAPNVVGGLAAPLLAADPQEATAVGLSATPTLTRQAWLHGMANGVDHFTAANQLGFGAPHPLLGLGEWGNADENVDPTGANVPAPVLELRRIRQGLTPNEFANIALGFFDYVVALNSAAPGADPAPYHPAALPARRATKWQKLLFWIATNT